MSLALSPGSMGATVHQCAQMPARFSSPPRALSGSARLGALAQIGILADLRQAGLAEVPGMPSSSPFHTARRWRRHRETAGGFKMMVQDKRGRGIAVARLRPTQGES